MKLEKIMREQDNILPNYWEISDVKPPFCLQNSYYVYRRLCVPVTCKRAKRVCSQVSGATPRDEQDWIKEKSFDLRAMMRVSH